MKMETLLIYSSYFMFGLVLLSWLFTSVVIVRQKTAAIIETFGKFSSVKKPRPKGRGFLS